MPLIALRDITDTSAIRLGTTELGAFAKLEPEFTKRNVKLIGLSANDLDSHGKWINDIDEVTGSSLNFPIIGDAKREVAWLYDMVDYQDLKNVEAGTDTLPSVFLLTDSFTSSL